MISPGWKSGANKRTVMLTVFFDRGSRQLAEASPFAGGCLSDFPPGPSFKVN
jgi:hypothetical protein